MEFQDISFGSLVQALDRSINFRLRDNLSGEFISDTTSMCEDNEIVRIKAKYGKYIVKKITASDNGINTCIDIEIERG